MTVGVPVATAEPVPLGVTVAALLADDVADCVRVPVGETVAPRDNVAVVEGVTVVV